jgi:hypothetical protein
VVQRQQMDEFSPIAQGKLYRSQSRVDGAPAGEIARSPLLRIRELTGLIKIYVSFPVDNNSDSLANRAEVICAFLERELADQLPISSHES